MTNIPSDQERKILVTGALGQIGTELVPALRARYGAEKVVASDVRVPSSGTQITGPFEHLDCTRLRQLQDVVSRYRITMVFHLAGLLSAVAEDKPQVAWDVNMGGLYRVLEVVRQHGCALFFPSSIGAFGPRTPKHGTPQETVQRPTTMYGISKVTGELLCDYYFRRFGVDTRGLRLPGIISYVALPGGGTTDYAVEMFYDAIRYHHYSCFLRADSACEMMYMPDAIRAIIELMEANPKRLVHRNAYNVGAMSFTPAGLASEIRKHIPAFTVDYDVDPVRQSIAESWPDSLDDSAARSEWDWRPQYDLERMTAEMLHNLRTRIRSVVSE